MRPEIRLQSAPLFVTATLTMLWHWTQIPLVVRHRVLEVAGRQSRSFGDARQHPRADFFAVMKREHEVWPAGT